MDVVKTSHLLSSVTNKCHKDIMLCTVCVFVCTYALAVLFLGLEFLTVIVFNVYLYFLIFSQIHSKLLASFGHLQFKSETLGTFQDVVVHYEHLGSDSGVMWFECECLFSTIHIVQYACEQRAAVCCCYCSVCGMVHIISNTLQCLFERDLIVRPNGLSVVIF